MMHHADSEEENQDRGMKVKIGFHGIHALAIMVYGNQSVKAFPGGWFMPFSCLPRGKPRLSRTYPTGLKSCLMFVRDLAFNVRT